MGYKPDMMIYHANCADGFGAAWAAWYFSPCTLAGTRGHPPAPGDFL